MAVKLAAIIFSMIFVDNYVLSKFLGICPFLGVSKKLNSAVGMSVAVTVVMVIATAATWPDAPGRLRCNRYYTLKAGDRLLAEGKTEWIMLEPATGKMVKTEGNYPADLDHCPDVVCGLPFSRMDDKFDDCTELGVYRVNSGDIAVSQHMNNVRYIHALMGMLTTAQIEQLGITGAEAIFRIQCFEGESLSIRTRPWEEGIDLAAVKPDGKTAMILRLTCTGTL